MSQALALAQGVAQMRLQVDAPAQQKLLDYMALLQKWNKVYNLTAVRTDEMLTLHLLDSLSVLPHLGAKNVLDVGSGAGLPGIVLAICLPDVQVTTIDTVQKKAIFMRQAKGELGLNNLSVVHERVENFNPSQKFDAIISRAFADMALFVSLTKHLLAPEGRWLAMKGKLQQQEIDGAGALATQIIPLSVAGLEAERHLIVLKPTP